MDKLLEGETLRFRDDIHLKLTQLENKLRLRREHALLPDPDLRHELKHIYDLVTSTIHSQTSLQAQLLALRSDIAHERSSPSRTLFAEGPSLDGRSQRERFLRDQLLKEELILKEEARMAEQRRRLDQARTLRQFQSRDELLARSELQQNIRRGEQHRTRGESQLRAQIRREIQKELQTEREQLRARMKGKAEEPSVKRSIFTEERKETDSRGFRDSNPAKTHYSTDRQVHFGDPGRSPMRLSQDYTYDIKHLANEQRRRFYDEVAPEALKYQQHAQQAQKYQQHVQQAHKYQQRGQQAQKYQQRGKLQRGQQAQKYQKLGGQAGRGAQLGSGSKLQSPDTAQSYKGGSGFLAQNRQNIERSHHPDESKYRGQYKSPTSDLRPALVDNRSDLGVSEGSSAKGSSAKGSSATGKKDYGLPQANRYSKNAGRQDERKRSRSRDDKRNGSQQNRFWGEPGSRQPQYQQGYPSPYKEGTAPPHQREQSEYPYLPSRGLEQANKKDPKNPRNDAYPSSLKQGYPESQFSGTDPGRAKGRGAGSGFTGPRDWQMGRPREQQGAFLKYPQTKGGNGSRGRLMDPEDRFNPNSYKPNEPTDMHLDPALKGKLNQYSYSPDALGGFRPQDRQFGRAGQGAQTFDPHVNQRRNPQEGLEKDSRSESGQSLPQHRRNQLANPNQSFSPIRQIKVKDGSSHSPHLGSDPRQSRFPRQQVGTPDAEDPLRESELEVHPRGKGSKQKQLGSPQSIVVRDQQDRERRPGTFEVDGLRPVYGKHRSSSREVSFSGERKRRRSGSKGRRWQVRVKDETKRRVLNAVKGQLRGEEEFLDSKHRNVKHELQHLRQTYQLQRKIRGELVERILNFEVRNRR